ncbi:hypothetical protein CKO31_11100 [Thiohalocapsa halophila]|uniref:Uncharacterized protein n=1 Tax=Thiohalocapsa halophila TaxID=69359 RepID=A0ABS1CH81_9GAMM|nr:hypothetical protein [Thiohalocapsa halophila]MBK1631275.1 hypothetical protein [Thiohalocapsa halophila]
MHYPAIGRCWHCGTELTELDYAREATCPGCRKATHCCRNCRWYAPGRANDCAEPVAEAVTYKDRANFCGYFEPSFPQPAAGAQDDPDALRQAAEDLFKDGQ